MRTHPSTVLAALTSMTLLGLVGMTVEGPAEAMDETLRASRAVPPRVGQLVVTPDDQFSGNLNPNDPSEVASFTVEYEGNELDDPFIEVTLSCFPTGPVACSSISESSPLHLDLNTPVNVNVTFSTTSSIGLGTIMLSANGSGYFDSGWRNYQVGPGILVNELSVPSSVVQNSDDNTATFEVQNGTGSTQTYQLTCAWEAPAPCPNPSSVQIPGGMSDTITVTFDAGSLLGSYELELTASDGTNSDSDAGNVTVAEFLSVNTVPKYPVAYARPDVQRTDTFVVRFPGQTSSSSFELSVSCPGGSGARSCTISPLADTLKSLSDTPVNVVVQYTAGNDGVTSEVSLTAEKVGASWVKHTGTLSVVAASDIVLDVENANPGLEVDRSDCLTVAAGPGSIVCDDYQFVYPFLPVTRMNTPRQIGLIYNSSIAYPQGRTGMNIVLPLEEAEPDSISVELVIEGTSAGVTTYSESLYQRGEPFRVARSWTWPASVGTFEQLVSYDFIVRRYDAGTLQATDTASGKHISLDKRRWFGRGWWLAGYEHIRARTDADLGDVLIWTGGDASARVYVETSSSSNVFVGWSRSLGDTITYNGSSQYVRHVLGGGHVYFNSSGYHTHTVSASNDTTYFDHAVDGPYTVPVSIRAPTPSGPDTIFKLDYHNTDARLQTVRVRSGSGGWDTYNLHATSGGSQYQIDSIVDPAGQKLRLWWLGTAPGYRLDSIVDLRGATTNIGWSSNAVWAVTTKAPPDTVVIAYRAASPVGVSPSGSNAYRPRPIESWRARLDGPLPGSADTTGFFTTGWGAVRGVRDALGNATWIERQDPDFEALPTRIRHPNGWEVTAAYTALGLPDTIIDRSNGAITTLQWNTTWRQPSQITSPEGLVTTFRYDGGTGNLEARVVAGQFKDSLRYNGDNQVDQSVDPLGAVTTFSYDASGNLSTVTPPDSTWAHYFRDGRGYVTKVTQPTGVAGDSTIVVVALDVMGRDTLKTTTNTLDSMRVLVRTTYDAAGQVTEVEPIGLDYVSSQWDTTRVGSSEWVYDGLGRATVIRTPVAADTVMYDDNVTKVVNNGDTITLRYDLLGRLSSRRTSQQFYPDSTLNYGWDFPLLASSGLTIAAATDTFTYDVMGNLKTANNAVSRIGRTYALNGALQSEVDSLKNYGSSSFTNHVYERSFAYDLDGRRVALFHPTWITDGSDRTLYDFDETTGRLASVTDVLGTKYAFTYDAVGRRRVMTAPSVVDSMKYSADGRLERRATRINGTLTSLSTSLAYDAARRLKLSGYDYNGLGGATSYSGNGLDEGFQRDPFGFATFHHPLDGDPAGAFSIDQIPLTGGRVQAYTELWAEGGDGGQEPDGWLGGWIHPSYNTRGDLAGIETREEKWHFNELWEATHVGQVRGLSRSYYAADGKLMVHQINRDSLEFELGDTIQGDAFGAYEEYWYDALGRRVLKRSYQESPICSPSTRCYSAIDRFVWDGDNILWEFRQAGAGDTKDPGPTPSNGRTGHVGYVHAGGVDAPLGMVRNDSSLVLHRDFRGFYYAATTTNGTAIGAQLAWPAYTWTVNMQFTMRMHPGMWMGSVPMAHLDDSGLLYRRNRYLDTQTAQFTQPDPIGFEGGFNLYAYAGGDPVNFRDPFGLDNECAQEIAITLGGKTRHGYQGIDFKCPPKTKGHRKGTDYPSTDGSPDATVGATGVIQADLLSLPPGFEDFARCVGSTAWENATTTYAWVSDHADIRWALRGARTALGTLHLATDSPVPGLLGLGWDTWRNPLTRNPVAIISSGARAGTKLVGRAAVRAALGATAKAAAVSYAGLHIGIGVGSLGIGVHTCAAGG